jgi:hypothetical protein
MSGHDDDIDSQRNKGSAGSYQAFDLVGSSRPRVDQPAFNLTYSQAATTVAGSTIGDYKSSMQDSGDDRVSRISMYTYTSGDAEQFRKQIGGRVSQVVFASALQPPYQYLSTSLSSLCFWCMCYAERALPLQFFNVLNDAYCLPTGVYYLRPPL